MLERTHPVVGKVLAFPRTRRLSWTALALEFGHQLVLALWIGTLVAVASLAVPALLEASQDTQLGARVILDLLTRVSFLGCGAGVHCRRAGSGPRCPNRISTCRRRSR